MQRAELNPETVSINNQLSECGSRKQLSRARTLFADAQKRGLANDFTFGIMVNVCIRCGQLSQAKEHFARMKQLGMRPGVVTYTTLLKGLCGEGQISQATELLTEMEQKKVKPNVRTINTFLRGCQQAGATEQADVIFAKMGPIWKFQPDISSYEYYMSLLCQALHLQKGLALLEAVKSAGLLESPSLHLSLARAAVLLGERDVAVSELALVNKLGQESETKPTNTETQVPKGKATTGGKQAWREQPDEERQRSAEVFGSHRAQEWKRDAQLISAALERTAQTQLDVLPFYSKLLLFASESAGNVDSLLCTLAKFGFSEYLQRRRANAPSQKKAKKNTPEVVSNNDDKTDTKIEEEQTVRDVFNRFIDPFGRARFMWLFADKQEQASHLPIKMEIGSGTGDWVTAQALHDQGKANWVSLELRYDRVYHTFAKMVLNNVSNLCVMGGDATRVLPLHVSPKQVSAIFINHPEPPQQTNSKGFDSEGAHLLCASFFLEMHRILAPQGTLTIVTDNLWYGRVLLRIVANLRQAAESKAHAFSSVSLVKPDSSVVLQEEYQGFQLFRNPGPECGIAVSSSSYFDRLWVKESLIHRYFLYLTKVEPVPVGTTSSALSPPTTTKKKKKRKKSSVSSNGAPKKKNPKPAAGNVPT